jgi:hypothetical protein
MENRNRPDARFSGKFAYPWSFAGREGVMLLCIVSADDSFVIALFSFVPSLDSNATFLFCIGIKQNSAAVLLFCIALKQSRDEAGQDSAAPLLYSNAAFLYRNEPLQSSAGVLLYNFTIKQSSGVTKESYVMGKRPVVFRRDRYNCFWRSIDFR